MATHSEKIYNLESNYKVMSTKMNDIEKTVNKIDEKMDTLIDKLDTRYARKSSVDKLWTIVWSVVGFCFVALGGALLKILIK